jgi:hypothetical protein
MSGMTNVDRESVRRAGRVLAVSAAAILLLAGCGSANEKPASRTGRDARQPDASRSTEQAAAISNTDPCAMRLHDVCGPLLLYYAVNHHLPDRLDELLAVPGFEGQVHLTCPVSNRPYVYNRVGMFAPETLSRIVIYDPAPAHANMRWGVSIIEPQEPGGALVAKVIALPESMFLFQPAAR